MKKKFSANIISIIGSRHSAWSSEAPSQSVPPPRDHKAHRCSTVSCRRPSETSQLEGRHRGSVAQPSASRLYTQHQRARGVSIGNSTRRPRVR